MSVFFILMANIYVHVIRILDFPLQHGIIQCFANQCFHYITERKYHPKREITYVNLQSYPSKEKWEL